MEVFTTIVPIILLVFTGFIFNKIKLFDEHSGAILNKFIFNAAFPALVFDSIVHTTLSEILDWRLLFGFLLVTYVIFFIVFFIFRYGCRDSISVSTFAGMNASISNSYLIALPILIALFGVKATVPITVTAISVFLFYVPLVTFFLEYDKKNVKKNDRLFIKALKNTLKNPLVIAAMMGVCFSAFHLELPTPVLQWLRYIGNTSIGVALITVGIELGDIKFVAKIRPVVFLTVMDLFIKPILAFATAWFLRMPSMLAIVLITVCGVPTAKFVFIMSKNYQIYEEETAGNILLSSIVSIFTIPLFLSIAMHYWPISVT